MNHLLDLLSATRAAETGSPRSHPTSDRLLRLVDRRLGEAHQAAHEYTCYYSHAPDPQDACRPPTTNPPRARSVSGRGSSVAYSRWHVYTRSCSFHPCVHLLCSSRNSCGCQTAQNPHRNPRPRPRTDHWPCLMWMERDLSS